MKRKLEKIALYIVAAALVTMVCNCLQSDYLIKFLKERLVEILITLLAINIATCAILIAKLDELAITYNTNFKDTVSEIRLSIISQIWLIGITVVVLILYNSKFMCDRLGEYHQMAFSTVLTAIFICAIDILRDTGMGIFMINTKNK